MAETKAKILYIEDVKSLRDDYTALLKKRFSDYDVITAENWRDGCVAATQSDVAAVITDNVMPRYSDTSELKPHARELCERILRVRKDVIPIAVFSSEVANEDKEALQNKNIHVSKGKSLDDFTQIMDFISIQLTQHTHTPTHLPADYKQPRVKLVEQREL